MREFNTEGICIPSRHYMVDITEKLKKIYELISKGKYFTINRARQYGKTTTLNQLAKFLANEYFVIEISFEGLGNSAFEDEKSFCSSFITLIDTRLEQGNAPQVAIDLWRLDAEQVDKLELLSRRITNLMIKIGKDVVLMVDEVDKSSNNQLFLHFLGMLRNKYLDRDKGFDQTFHSIILAGVHDVKNLKLKLRNDEEQKFNSPWNIAADFRVDMSFNPYEISTMLIEYEKDYHTQMDIKAISEEIYSYTSGYPFLVSRVCKVIDERIGKKWDLEGVEEAVKLILTENNTLFDSLIKNIENNPKFKTFIYDTLIEGNTYSFVQTNPIISMGVMHGVFKAEKSKVKFHNKIFEILIYNHLAIEKEIAEKRLKSFETSQFINKQEDLDIERVMLKFQELMKNEYRNEDEKFIEREGRLLFLAFLKPIINGIGFYFVEAQTRSNRRMDIVITYNRKRYVIELKIWRGDNAQEEGFDQVSEYLDILGEDKGYMLIFNFNKKKKCFAEWHHCKGKDIFAVVV